MATPEDKEEAACEPMDGLAFGRAVEAACLAAFPIAPVLREALLAEALRARSNRFMLRRRNWLVACDACFGTRALRKTVINPFVLDAGLLGVGVFVAICVIYCIPCGEIVEIVRLFS